MAKKVQYFKVIDVRNGHHGLFYRLGLNKDPRPVPFEQMDPCAGGAIYFVTLDELHKWSDKGSHIAWVEPVDEIDKDGEKYRAHAIKITKMLPAEEAIPLLAGADLTLYEAFSVTPPLDKLEKLVKSRKKIAEFLIDADDIEALVKFLKKYPKDKSLLAYVKDAYMELTVDDIKAIVKAGLTSILDDSAIRELFEAKEFKLLKQILQINPDRFLQWVWEII